MSAVQPPPLRSLDDFIRSSARFAVPDVRDLDRWNNRIITNWLYSDQLFSDGGGNPAAVGYLQPFQLIVGAAVVTILFLGFVWAAENQAPIRRFRRNHPSICVLAILSASYIFLSVLGSVATFLFGIAFPILMMLIHASFRLRNLKNKMENKLGASPEEDAMGLLLEALGQEQEAGS
ncbi:PRA1 family protein 2 [Thalassophryne amazonica]|uniref:PRA1 family protein 2 n=1 Tax=Thalassophryne amazonica TaxID=390379 RepID=UPI001470AFF9|nr:PRA1 family protein 2 [Thalassophryne amazonica]